MKSKYSEYNKRKGTSMEGFIDALFITYFENNQKKVLSDELFGYLLNASEKEAFDTLIDVLLMSYTIDLDYLFSRLPQNHRVIERDVNLITPQKNIQIPPLYLN